MKDASNIALAFATVARQRPDQDAIIAEDLSLTYEKLRQITERFAQKMQVHGIGRGSVVAVDTSDMIVSVASLFALSSLGACYFNLDGMHSPEEQNDVTHFLRSPERSANDDMSYIPMDHTWSPKHLEPDLAPVEVRGFADPSDACWMLGSSGTTGQPKYISVSAQTLATRLAVVQADYPSKMLRHLILFGCNSRPFPIRAIATLLAGGTIIDSHDFHFLERHKVNFVSGSPKQVTAWFGDRRLARKIGVLQLSGSKLDDSLLRHLLLSFEVVEDVYGSNETILAYVTSHRSEQAPTGRLVASEIEVINQDESLCEVGQTGLLRIRNPHMALCYQNDSRATAKHFRNGWFYPGDIASWTVEGLLQVSGRADDIVNVLGRKISLADLDSAMNKCPAVEVACCLENLTKASMGQLAACVQPAAGITIANAAKAAWSACANAYGADMTPEVILIVKDLPLTQDGMPRRKHCQELFDHHLAVANSSSHSTTLFRFQPKDENA